VASAPIDRNRKSPPATGARPDHPGPKALLGPARAPSPGGGIRIPIAIKFAVLIAFLVMIFMAWLTITAMEVAERSQDAAVNESGIKDVNALAAQIDPVWITERKQQVRLIDFLQKYCASTREVGVLNAVIYSASGDQALATGKPKEERFSRSQGIRVAFPLADREGVEIGELRYNDQPARMFSRVVVGPGGGAPIARVEVLLSALRISQARDAMRDQMVMISLAASAVAALVSYLLARFLTYPIRTLARDLRQVSIGNLDHQSRVRSGDEIGEVARTFNQMTANLRQAQEAVVARKAMEHELNLATRIQNRLLPATIPGVPGLEIGAYYRAAREVGGDYYDFIQIDEEHLGIVVADVSGKGVPGSLVMTMTRSLLRMAAAGQPSPSETIAHVNRILAPDVNPGMFVTLLYLVIHTPTRRVRLVRAGHNAPILYVSRAAKLLHLQPRGIALGLDPRGSLFEKELEVQQFTLRPGDFFVAYTDGIVEGKDVRGEDYTDDRFARILSSRAAESPSSIIEAVIADLETHRGAADQSDDITLLVLKAVE
jgi:serine phosphatase RsbU (regulator of sigma subunit)